MIDRRINSAVNTLVNSRVLKSSDGLQRPLLLQTYQGKRLSFIALLWFATVVVLSSAAQSTLLPLWGASFDVSRIIPSIKKKECEPVTQKEKRQK